MYNVVSLFPPRTEVYLCQDDRENEPDDAYEDA